MKTDTLMQTILIIDDEATNINVLNELLQPHYHVLFARDGKTGMKIVQSQALPDLILLDIIMPDLDGFQVTKMLKSDETTSKIPIIFITAKDDEEDQAMGFDMGAVDYITKPFSPVVVKARVKAHLELKRHRDFLEWMLRERTKELHQMEKEYLNLFYRKDKKP